MAATWHSAWVKMVISDELSFKKKGAELVAESLFVEIPQMYVVWNPER
jgi:hypothetical protein